MQYTSDFTTNLSLSISLPVVYMYSAKLEL